MNARQKCKKLKKQLKILVDNQPFVRHAVKTNPVPIHQYEVKCVISRDDPEFQMSPEIQEDMIKNHFANQYADFIKNNFHITEIKEDEGGKAYYMKVWIGQN